MDDAVKSLVKELADSLSEKKVDDLATATTTMFVALLDTLVKSGALTLDQALAVPMKAEVSVAGREGSEQAKVIRQMALAIQHAFTDDAGRKPN
ncbi:MAG: hypothetical protein ABL901_11025 [Hyphomicrobiaceae bacterium]